MNHRSAHEQRIKTRPRAPRAGNRRREVRYAMTITDQAEADAYFEACVQHTISFGKPRAEAEKIERSNIGYYGGYYDHETMARTQRLFRCAHPIFGGIAEKGPPTPDEALNAGLRAGYDAKRGAR
jgi:hypothetical protein